MKQQVDKPRPLDQRDLAILRALGASPTNWHSRAAIAAMLDKVRLDSEYVIALDVLVSEGRIEKQKMIGLHRGEGKQVYRIAASKDAGQ